MIINSVDEVDRIRCTILAAADEAAADLSTLAARTAGLTLLEKIRFERIGRHPLQDRALNLVEQVNQTFTLLASLAAVDWLFKHHPAAAPFELNPGAMPGTDILGNAGSVGAEVFAAVDPANNRKLEKDIAKVSEVAAAARFVFYYSPNSELRRPNEVNGVQVVPLSREALFVQGPPLASAD